MTITATKAAAATAAFAQGVKDENDAAPSTRRLTIAANVRNFYDAARRQQATKLAPARATKEAKAAQWHRDMMRSIELEMVGSIRSGRM